VDDVIDYFTNQLGIALQIIPQGLKVIPPTQNVESFGLSQDLQETKQYLNRLFDSGDGEEEDDDDQNETTTMMDYWELERVTTTTTTTTEEEKQEEYGVSWMGAWQ
jgi:hypothetical protein